MSMTTPATSAETSSRPFPLFSAGQIVATPGALALLEQHGVSPQTILHRHLVGDWGALCSDDVAANEAALTHGSRLLSSYEIAPGVAVWIITDAETYPEPTPDIVAATLAASSSASNETEPPSPVNAKGKKRKKVVESVTAAGDTDTDDVGAVTEPTTSEADHAPTAHVG